MMPNVEKPRSGITDFETLILTHTSLEWEDFRWPPGIEHRISYAAPKRIVTPNAMTLSIREISILLAITL